MVTKFPVLAILIMVLVSLLAPCSLLSEDTRIHHHRTAGDGAFTKGDYAEAEKQYKAGLELARRSGVHESSVVFVAGDLARLYSAQKRNVEAERLFQERLLIAERIWPNDPANLSQVYHDLALFYLTHHRYDDAKKIYERTIALKEQAFGPNAPQMADTLELYALLLRENGHNDEAMQMEARARTIRGN